jgi:hypothetical protein
MEDLSIQEQAIHMHEYYLSMISAGFSPHQSMHIVCGKPCCEYEENV